MKLGGRRGDNFQIGKESGMGELLGYLTEEGTFSLVLDMMDGESCNHEVERSKWRQWIIQVPGSNGDLFVACESTPCMPEHGWRRIYGDNALDSWAVFEDKGR